MRISLLVLVLITGAACNGGAPALTSPSPSPSGASQPQTFVISGTVHDTLSRPVGDARVEVQDGPQRGLAVFTDAGGRYSFESVVQGPILVRASKAGYREQSIRIAHPQAARFFRLDSAQGSTSLHGRFTMTFTADGSCTAIPGYARRRSYEASSTGSGFDSFYVITLAGGGYNLAGNGGYFSNTLYAGVFEETAQVNMSDPPIWERFPQGSYLVVHGAAQGPVREFPATLPLDAHFTYCAEMLPAAEPSCAVSEVTCRSSNHRLTVAVQ